MWNLAFEDTGLFPFLEANDNLAIANKLWGDNMGLIEKNKQVTKLLLERDISQSYAVSAFRSSKMDFNTTSKLIEAGESESIDTVIDILSEISDFHTTLLEDVLKEANPSIRKELITYAQELFAQYKENTLSSSDIQGSAEINDYMVWVWEQAFTLLSVWEIPAAKIFVKYLRMHDIEAQYIDTSTLKHINKNEVDNRIWDFLQAKLWELFKKNPKAVPIIPGYIWGIEWGIIPKLGRGYTDYTGERSAVAMHDSKVFSETLLYIQKLYGFKSSDPNVVPKAKSVNKLSYDLTKRAISKKWAWAWLINEFALSRDIISRKIPILVGNPTKPGDKAHIDEYGDKRSNSVGLVLGRDYSDKDDWRQYSRKSQSWWGRNHNVYLMGENIKDIWGTYDDAMRLLRENNIQEIAAKSTLTWQPEISLVFESEEVAVRAQKILHEYFIEDKAA